MDYWDFHGAGMQGTVAGSSEHVKRMNDRPRVLLREICAFLRQLAGQRLDMNIGAERNDLKNNVSNAWHVCTRQDPDCITGLSFVSSGPASPFSLL
jgi:hypothetical protein